MNSLGTIFNVPEQVKNCSLIKNKISQGRSNEMGEHNNDPEKTVRFRLTRPGKTVRFTD